MLQGSLMLLKDLGRKKQQLFLILIPGKGKTHISMYLPCFYKINFLEANQTPFLFQVLFPRAPSLPLNTEPLNVSNVLASFREEAFLKLEATGQKTSIQLTDTQQSKSHQMLHSANGNEYAHRYRRLACLHNLPLHTPKLDAHTPNSTSSRFHLLPGRLKSATFQRAVKMRNPNPCPKLQMDLHLQRNHATKWFTAHANTAAANGYVRVTFSFLSPRQNPLREECAANTGWTR